MALVDSFFAFHFAEYSIEQRDKEVSEEIELGDQPRVTLSELDNVANAEQRPNSVLTDLTHLH